MGANTRTYRFALGHALLSLAGEGRDSVTLWELAAPYVLAMAQHAQHFLQAPQIDSLGERDYFRALAEESPETLAIGTPTDRLLDVTVRTIPGMVMVSFHNHKGEDVVPHRFYSLTGRGDEASVTLTPGRSGAAAIRHDRKNGEQCQVLDGCSIGALVDRELAESRPCHWSGQ